MVLLSPGGTAEIYSVSAVPPGLRFSPTLFPALEVPGYFRGVPLGRENTGEHLRTEFIRLSGNVSATNDVESVFSSAEPNPAESSTPMLLLRTIPGDAVGVFHLRSTEKIQGAAVGQVDAATTETID